MTTPNPPVLANKSWQSFFADIISSNGWSPLNNPLLTKGQKSTSLENVIGFPVFGTVLAYHKLYGSGEGAKVLAETTANLSSRSFKLASVGETIASPFNIKSAYQLNLKSIAPFSHRNMKAILNQFKVGIGNINSKVPWEDKDLLTFISSIRSMNAGQLRAVLGRVTGGDIFGAFVASFVCTVAIQEIISESIMLDNKVKLRGKLVAELEKQKSAPLPDLSNLLYYDIEHRQGAGWVQRVVPDDYQPTDPVELERLMGSRELHRAFLLATLE